MNDVCFAVVLNLCTGVGGLSHEMTGDARRDNEHCSLSRFGVQITDFGLTWGVQNESPLF